jgi:cell division protein FtsB
VSSIPREVQLECKVLVLNDEIEQKSKKINTLLDIQVSLERRIEQLEEFIIVNHGEEVLGNI